LGDAIRQLTFTSGGTITDLRLGRARRGAPTVRARRRV